MRSQASQPLITLTVVVLTFAVGNGCASTTGAQTDLQRPQVDREWTAEDEAANESWERAFRDAEQSESAFDTAPEPPPAARGARDPESDSDFLLRVYVFDIGQADSMLVVGPGNRTLLIDLGEPTSGSKLPPDMTSSAEWVRQRIEEITGRQEVDYFVASHYHSDHLGWALDGDEGWGTGFIGLLSDFSQPFSVGEFIHIGNDGAELMNPERRGVYEAIRRRLPTWERFDRVSSSGPPHFGTDQINLGPGVEVDILAFTGRTPSGASAFDKARADGVDYSRTPGDENDLSIALEITAGDFEMFTAGDLNGTDDPQENPTYVLRDWGQVYTNVEHHLVDEWESPTPRESDVEIYRANHHGSAYSSTQRLLDALDPEFILYSTGGDHRHPSNRVVRRGGRTAVQLATTWVTDLQTFVEANGERVGEIEIVVARDGRSYTINGEKHLAFSTEEEKSGADEGEEHREH